MKRQSSRWFVLVLLALAAGAASLLVPERAAAEKRLFRVQRSFFGAPFPAAVSLTHTAGSMIVAVQPKVILYGGAGRYENFIEPGTFNGVGVPSTASVTAMNPVGGKFTLPRSFIDYMATSKAYSSTAFTGYTSFSYVTYVNGRGRFKASNPGAATKAARVVFLTTGSNKVPNQGAGSPLVSTTTFGGDFDFSRAGSINVTPGPNRFGGTMRILYDTNTSKFYQYIGYFAPAFFKAYGTFNCLYQPDRTANGQITGGTCTEDLDTKVGMVTAGGRAAGQITSTGMVSRFLLDPTVFTNTAGTTMIGRTMYRKVADPPVISKAYYLHLLAPWTTGMVADYNIDSTYKIAPKITGYDKVFAAPGTDLTFTHTSTTAVYMGGMVSYFYMTDTEMLNDVTRAVSLVRPRLIHTYLRPRIETDPIVRNFTAARMWTMKVYFMPEPSALLLLGSGIAGLAGLYLLRRR